MSYANAIWTDAQQNKSGPPEQAIDEAIAEAEIARSILEPEPPIPLQSQSNTIYLHLGRYYRIKGEFLDGAGRHDEAMRLYQRSLDSLVKAQVLDRVTSQVSREFRLRQGVPPEEIPDGGNPLVYEVLGMTYTRLGQWENCEMAGRYLERIAPESSSGYLLVGAAYFRLGRYADAAMQQIAGVLINPGNSDFWTNLNITYNSLGMQPNSITTQGPRSLLNTEIPFVRQQVNDAAVMVVRLFEDAKQSERARELQGQLIKQYSVPPEVFSRK